MVSMFVGFGLFACLIALVGAEDFPQVLREPMWWGGIFYIVLGAAWGASVQAGVL